MAAGATAKVGASFEVSERVSLAMAEEEKPAAEAAAEEKDDEDEDDASGAVAAAAAGAEKELDVPTEELILVAPAADHWATFCSNAGMGA